MNRHRAAAVLAVTILGVAAGRAAAPPAFSLQSVTVELPPGTEQLPPGPDVAAVAANCQVCHSVGMILTQPKLSKAAWEAEVTKMINVYKAPVQTADVPAIVAYLVAVKG